jgi:hypothetical protein
MQYCRKLYLPFECDHGNFFTEETRISPYPIDRIDKQLVALLSTRDIFIDTCEVFYSPPYSDIPIHIDNGHAGQMTKLNVCVSDEISVVNWYGVTDDYQMGNVQETETGGLYIGIDRKYAYAVHTECIKGTYIFNAGIPHDSTNYTSQKRWTLSMLLWDTLTNKHLQFDQALIRFSQYYEKKQ